MVLNLCPRFFAKQQLQQLKAGLRSASVSYLFSTISVISIISTPTGPIFAELAGVIEMWLWMNDVS